MAGLHIPERFCENIIKSHGHAGQKWLESIPGTLEILATRWNLESYGGFNELSFNYAVHALKDGREPVVLKLSASASGYLKEFRALNCFAGNGCVQLIANDDEHRALLLDRINPGSSLAEMFPGEDEKAATIAVQLMNRLHHAPITDLTIFPTVVEWLKVIDEPEFSKSIPVHNLARASEIARQLLSEMKNTVLLHGDLHHTNILKNGDSWVAIDPQGVVGEPCYEAAAFIRNPHPGLFRQSDIAHIISTRLAIFSSLLDVPINRLRNWGYVQAILSACWCVEDNSEGLEEMIMCAEIIEKAGL